MSDRSDRCNPLSLSGRWKGLSRIISHIKAEVREAKNEWKNVFNIDSQCGVEYLGKDSRVDQRRPEKKNTIIKNMPHIRFGFVRTQPTAPSGCSDAMVSRYLPAWMRSDGKLVVKPQREEGGEGDKAGHARTGCCSSTAEKWPSAFRTVICCGFLT